MSTQSLQLIRMAKFIEELKKNRYPTVETMLLLLREADIDEGIPYTCSERTLRRDIGVLKKDFRAPIVFDRKHNGYALTDPAWQFVVPVFAPPPQVKAHVNPKVLRTLFDAHREKKIVNFVYKSPNKEDVLRTLEPHVLTLYRGIWYVRGKKPGSHDIRTYAVQRIPRIRKIDETFVPDQKLIDETMGNGPFDFEKRSDVIVEIEPSSLYYFEERASAEGYKILEEKADGTALVQLPPMTELEVLRFILGGFGEVRLVSPDSLRQAILESIQCIAAVHRKA